MKKLLFTMFISSSLMLNAMDVVKTLEQVAPENEDVSATLRVTLEKLFALMTEAKGFSQEIQQEYATKRAELEKEKKASLMLRKKKLQIKLAKKEKRNHCLNMPTGN